MLNRSTANVCKFGFKLFCSSLVKGIFGNHLLLDLILTGKFPVKGAE